MDIEILSQFFLWCLVINYTVLLLWFIFVMAASEWTFRIHTKIYHITREQFNLIHYCGMGLYKFLIFIFALVPYISLKIIDS